MGISGSYLLRRLTIEGFDVKGYDPKRANYYIPCGYATNERNILKYCKKAGIDFDEYVISRADNVKISGDNFKEKEFPGFGLCTFDKNKFENDMIKGLNVLREKIAFSENGIYLDCSGISRALLGPSKNDYTMNAIEYLTKKSSHEDFYFNFYANGRGYFWEFPMGNNYHVGAGGINIEENKKRLKNYDHFLTTGRRIRMKPLFDEMTRKNIYGIGESIGCVSPITGEGIVPTLRCADIFMESLDKAEDINDLTRIYVSRVKKEFDRYSGLHELVINIQNNKILTLNNLRYARSALNELRDFGISIRTLSIISHFV
ncbi:MAG: geranylgeranyl reductase family protein [Thermoplasmataceae archaeon]